jgi:hypothetical protein
MDSHGEMIWTEKTPDSSTRALWQTFHQSHLVANQAELAKETNFASEVFILYFERFFNMP